MRNFLRRFFFWSPLFSSKTILAVLILLAACCMFFSSQKEAAVVDEVAHIPAGYSSIRFLDYRLNPEHPPLLKALAAIPLLALQPSFPLESKAWEGVNDQWNVGHEFLYASHNNADAIIHLARLLPILITLLLILLTYRVARDQVGARWALLPAAYLALSPTILGHGHYVTTDVGASFGILLALWRAVRAFKEPTKKNIGLAGLALGIAELLKFSAVLLVPYLLLIAFAAWAIKEKGKRSLRSSLTTYLAILAIGYGLIVYPVYAIMTAHYPAERAVSDTAQILSSFHSGISKVLCGSDRCLAAAATALTHHAITRPLAHYFLGVLMVLQRSEGGNTAYFFGHVSNSGSHWYFLAVYFLKETIPALIFVLFPFLLWLTRTGIRPLRWHRALQQFAANDLLGISLLGFVIFYWLYSIQSPLNIGIRHILPVIPLMYILATAGWKKWIMHFPLEKNSPIALLRTFTRSLGAQTIKIIFLAALLLWALIETIIVAPHFLSYFNELGGGTKNGYRYVLDSNYDWGQDLLSLRNYLALHPEIDRVAVDYFGGGDISYSLGTSAVQWDSRKGDPRKAGIHWFAISLNSLQQGIQPTAPGFKRNAIDEYQWLTSFRSPEAGMGGIPPPDARIGTSIVLYHFP